MTQPQPGSTLHDLTHVRVATCAVQLYLCPSEVTENFLIKTSDDTRLGGLSKKVGIEVKITLTS